MAINYDVQLLDHNNPLFILKLTVLRLWMYKEVNGFLTPSSSKLPRKDTWEIVIKLLPTEILALIDALVSS